jgi:hypothetical protein
MAATLLPFLRRGGATPRAAVVCQQPSVVRRPKFRAAGGHGHAVSATVVTSEGAIVRTERRLTRGSSPKSS